MEKFWNWLEKSKHNYVNITKCGECGGYINIKNEKDNIPKQMLIGYMIEYLFHAGIEDAFDIFSSDMDSIYEYLEDMIKEVK